MHIIERLFSKIKNNGFKNNRSKNEIFYGDEHSLPKGHSRPNTHLLKKKNDVAEIRRKHRVRIYTFILIY